MPLKVDTAVKAELERIEDEKESAVEATVTKDGVEAEISTTKKGWTISAFAKKFWKGDLQAGAKIKHDL
jgi:hypothetical protein